MFPVKPAVVAARSAPPTFLNLALMGLVWQNLYLSEKDFREVARKPAGGF